MLYEFECSKCGGITATYYPIKEAPEIGTEIECNCGGQARRIVSQIHLRPEFFEYTLKNLSHPVNISSRRQRERFRREEYIKATEGTKLQETKGKLQYSDKYFKQEMKRKEKQRNAQREKALKDAYVKAEWQTRKK